MQPGLWDLSRRHLFLYFSTAQLGLQSPAHVELSEVVWSRHSSIIFAEMGREHGRRMERGGGAE